MNTKLTHKLVGILVFGLLLAFIAQLTTRYFFELPALYALENRSDAKDVQGIQNAIQQRLDSISGSTIDHGAWNDTYEAMLADSDSPQFKEFTQTIMNSTTYDNLELHGGVLIDNRGEVKYSNYTLKLASTITSPGGLDPNSLPSLKINQSITPVDRPLIVTATSHSNIGSVMFAASRIFMSEPPYENSMGILIFWRLMDDDFFDSIRNETQTNLNFIPIDSEKVDLRLNDKIKNLNASNVEFLPRDSDENIFWFFRDYSDHVLFLVQQKADIRAFPTHLFSTSVIIGFACSAFILIIILTFFSRTVIQRILHAKDIMINIVTTGDYDKRLATRGSNEIDTMFVQFNQLLSHIQLQNQELKNQNQELAHLSQHDALTGIFNRRYLDDALQRCWRQCVRSRQAMSVLMIDVDNFKAYNDKYGHQSGDYVLCQVAESLHDNLHRATDHIARYGGEEFCVILTDTLAESAIMVAERLREAITALKIQHSASDCADVVTVSIGVTTSQPNAAIVELDMVKMADIALYQSKQLGRNCVTANSSISESDSKSGGSK